MKPETNITASYIGNGVKYMSFVEFNRIPKELKFCYKCKKKISESIRAYASINQEGDYVFCCVTHFSE